MPAIVKQATYHKLRMRDPLLIDPEQANFSRAPLLSFKCHGLIDNRR